MSSVSYTGSGRLLVDVLPRTGSVYRWDFEEVEGDGDGWDMVREGVGLDYFCDHADFPGPGRYIVKFEVTYYPADFPYEEADEDFDILSVERTADDLDELPEVSS